MLQKSSNSYMNFYFLKYYDKFYHMGPKENCSTLTHSNNGIKTAFLNIFCIVFYNYVMEFFQLQWKASKNDRFLSEHKMTF